MTHASVATEARSRTVSAPGDPGFWPPMPNADVPVALIYSINAGQDPEGLPATGTVTVSLDLHDQEGAIPCPSGLYKAEDIVYAERYSAEGTIRTFSQEISFESGLIRP